MSLKMQGAKLWFARVLPGAMLLVLALFAGAPRAKADDWDDCNRRIARANWQLHEAVEDYGYDSRQARHWRHELHEAYERQEHLRRKYRKQQWRDREWRDRRDYDGEYYGDRERGYDRDEYRYRYYRHDRDDQY